MMILGIVVFILGTLWAALKCYIVWEITHDVFNGGGAPTLDFPIFCPIPLALGASIYSSSIDKVPFPGFGLTVYAALAILFGFLLWIFGRVGKSRRDDQLKKIREENGPEK